MRLITLSLLATAAVAVAARPTPVDTAINTAQGVGNQGTLSAYSRGGGGGVSDESVPELYPGENEDVGPQFLIMPKFRKTYFEGGLDVQYYYTSNALLSEKAHVDTSILLSTAYAGFAPTPIDLAGGKFAWKFGYREQVYNYGLDNTENQLNNLDFAIGTVYLASRYTFGANWTVSVGFDYNRYLSLEQDYTEFYTEALPQWGIEKFFEINDRNYITAGYFGSYHFTHADPQPSTNINDRLDSIFLLTSVHQLTDKIILQPYYRFQHSHYTENTDRNDVFNTFGVALAYIINDWASARIFTNYENRNSSDDFVPDYSKWDSGVGVSVAVKF